MGATSKRKVIPGSEKRILPKARVVGAVDPQQRIEVTLLLRARPSAAASPATNDTARRRPLSREQFAAECGATTDDIAKVEAFAHAHNLTVTQSSPARRTVKLSGTIGDLTAAFQPKLKRYAIGQRRFRGRTGGISVPSDLARIVIGVFGFDNRPAVRPHTRWLGERTNVRGALTAAAATASTFSPRQVAQLYRFPLQLNGKGQCIAIIELNDFNEHGKITGTGFSPTDLSAYFKQLKLPTPKVTAVGVDGGANMPGPDADADGEVMLDIQVAGAVAPAANIAVYFAPNTDQGFLDAILTALHDQVRTPSVISISWGGPEKDWTAQSLKAFNQVLQDASALGVTVCCSSGDDGSSDIGDPKDRDGHPHVDFPASSPFALACGGTTLSGSGATISSETVWNDGDGATGGGVSTGFARPPYQSGAKVPKSPGGKVRRGVPDVAGNADPNTGYRVRLVGGKQAVIGGTSAVSPLWSGLVALINQRLTTLGKPPVGFLNPILYAAATGSAFRDTISGDNDIEGLGKYAARKGWDACTGLGTPDGTKLMQVLGG